MFSLALSFIVYISCAAQMEFRTRTMSAERSMGAHLIMEAGDTQPLSWQLVGAVQGELGDGGCTSFYFCSLGLDRFLLLLLFQFRFSFLLASTRFLSQTSTVPHFPLYSFSLRNPPPLFLSLSLSHTHTLSFSLSFPLSLSFLSTTLVSFISPPPAHSGRRQPQRGSRRLGHSLSPPRAVAIGAIQTRPGIKLCDEPRENLQ